MERGDDGGQKQRDDGEEEHPSFPLTTIICENRLHKQVYNCFSRLALLVIVVYVEHNTDSFVPKLFLRIVVVSSTYPRPPPDPPHKHG